MEEGAFGDGDGDGLRKPVFKRLDGDAGNATLQSTAAKPNVAAGSASSALRTPWPQHGTHISNAEAGAFFEGSSPSVQESASANVSMPTQQEFSESASIWPLIGAPTASLMPLPAAPVAAAPLQPAGASSSSAAAASPFTSTVASTAVAAQPAMALALSSPGHGHSASADVARMSGQSTALAQPAVPAAGLQDRRPSLEQAPRPSTASRPAGPKPANMAGVPHGSAASHGRANDTMDSDTDSEAEEERHARRMIPRMALLSGSTLPPHSPASSIVGIGSPATVMSPLAAALAAGATALGSPPPHEAAAGVQTAAPVLGSVASAGSLNAAPAAASPHDAHGPLRQQYLQQWVVAAVPPPPASPMQGQPLLMAQWTGASGHSQEPQPPILAAEASLSVASAVHQNHHQGLSAAPSAFAAAASAVGAAAPLHDVPVPGDHALAPPPIAKDAADRLPSMLPGAPLPHNAKPAAAPAGEPAAAGEEPIAQRCTSGLPAPTPSVAPGNIPTPLPAMQSLLYAQQPRATEPMQGQASQVLAQALAQSGVAGSGGGGLAAPLQPQASQGSQRSAKPAPPSEAVHANLHNIDALALFDEEDEDEDEDAPPPLAWYRRPAVLWFLGTMAVSIVLLVIGIILHNVIETSTTVDAFRWFYFLAAGPPLYYLSAFAMQRLFLIIEWYYFRESLMYLVNIQHKCAWFLLFVLLLPWYYTVFRWAWCEPTEKQPNRCKQSAYVTATEAVWNVLLCLMLFCLANVLKAVIAKLLSTHFYRTAHFKKLKGALEKEYYLQVLSKPRTWIEIEREQLRRAAANRSAWGFGASFWYPSLAALSGRHTAAAGSMGHGAHDAPPPGAASAPAPEALATLSKPIPEAPEEEAEAAAAASAAVAAAAGTAGGGVLAMPRPLPDAVTVANGSAGAVAAPSPPASVRDVRLEVQPSSPPMQAATINTVHASAGTAPDGSVGGSAPAGGDPRIPDGSIRGASGASGAVPAAAAAGVPLLQGAQLAVAARAGSHTSKASKGSRASKVKAGMAGGPIVHESKKEAAALLTQEMLDVVPAGNGVASAKTVQQMSEDELDKVRTAIVIKTYTALIRKYNAMSDEEQERELVRVKRFAKALYYNVRGGAERDHVTLDDFLFFFTPTEVEADEMLAQALSGRQPTQARKGAPPAATTAQAASRGPVAAAASGVTAAAAAAVSGAVASMETAGAAAAKGLLGDVAGSRRRAQQRAAKEAAAARARKRRAAEALAQAKKAFAVFDGDGDGQVSRGEVRSIVVSIFKERRNMARSLMDTETIVQSLEFGIGVVIHFIFSAIYLLIWGVDLLQGFSTFSATVLALTFVFGNSVKNTYESMLFLFVVHPFDVGDVVFINNEMLRVKKISLLVTEMVRWNGERVYLPNTSMQITPITNWTRSKTKSETVRIVVDLGVPWEVREDIQAALRAYAKEHAGEFDGEPSVNYRELVDPLKMVMTANWTYNCSPDEGSRLGPARNGMLYVLQQKLCQHGLQHTMREVQEVRADELPGAQQQQPAAAAGQQQAAKPLGKQ